MAWNRENLPDAKWLKVDSINGGAALRISGRYLKPGWLETATVIWMAGLAAFCIWKYPSFHYWGTWFLEFAVYFLPAVPALIVMIVVWYFFLRSRLEILIDQNSISFGGRSYSRKTPIHFDLENHHKAVEAMERGRYVSKAHRKAVEVVMHSREGKAIVAEMRGRDIRRAEGLLVYLSQLPSADVATAEREIAGSSDISKADARLRSSATKPASS
jgi:hypothetical protein